MCANKSNLSNLSQGYVNKRNMYKSVMFHPYVPHETWWRNVIQWVSEGSENSFSLYKSQWGGRAFFDNKNIGILNKQESANSLHHWLINLSLSWIDMQN